MNNLCESYSRLSAQQQGLLLLASGALLLFYRFGFFEQILNLVVTGGSILMIYFGLEKLGIVARIKEQLNKK